MGGGTAYGGKVEYPYVMYMLEDTPVVNVDFPWEWGQIEWVNKIPVKISANSTWQWGIEICAPANVCPNNLRRLILGTCPGRKYIQERLSLFGNEWMVPISMVPSELHGVAASLSISDTVPSIGRGNPLTAGRPWGIVMGYITVCTHVLWNILCPCLLRSALFWGRSSSSSSPTYLQDSRDTTRTFTRPP